MIHENRRFVLRFPIVLVEYTPCGTSEPANQSEPIYSVEELLAHPFVRKYGLGGIADMLPESPGNGSECQFALEIPAGRIYPERAPEAERRIPCNP
jgi:hypothetical protein